MLPQSEDLIINVIILGYIVTFAMQGIRAAAHIKWGQKNGFWHLILAILWLWFAFRNYYHYRIKGDVVDNTELWMNAFGVLVLSVCNFYLTCDYFKHVRNWFKRNF